MKTKRILFTCGALMALVAGLLSSPEPVGAGAVNGARHSQETVLAGRNDVYNVRFRGREEAIVRVTGEGDLDLFIYDANGNLIAKDEAEDNTPVCVWTPRWTGTFKIVVKNCEGYDVDYVLQTN
jgi:hypothetical protein